MNAIRKINLALVTILGITAALPKIMRTPAEVGFFENAGFGDRSVVLVFGLVQLAGGVLLLFRRSRRWGAVAVALMFLGSAVMLMFTGNNVFALFSLIPVLMAGILVRESAGRESA